MSAIAAPARTTLPLPASRALVPARLARTCGFGALALWGALRWARLVVPGAALPLLAMVALAAAWAMLLRAIGRSGWPRAARAAAAIAGGAVVLAGVLLLTGISATLVLSPRNWGALGSGISEGIQGLPNAPTPYDGADEWIRWITLAGGGVLLATGAVAFVRLPDRAGLAARAWAATPLVVLAAVPAVVLSDRSGVVEGVGLFAALALALWLETVKAAAARGALVLLLGAALVGVAAGSAVDASHPWLAYDRLVLKLGPSHPETFDWNHRYGPLDWVRTGREVLRVHMRNRVYLKAENLDTFDGTRWRVAAIHPGVGQRGELPAHPARRWRQTLDVTLRSLSSRPVLGAGTSLEVTKSPTRVVGTGSPGTFESVSTLRPGSSYKVSVYAPTPSASALAGERADYPDWSDAYREILLPGRSGHRFTAQFASFGSGLAPLVLEPNGFARRSPAQIASTAYGPVYALAQRLAAGAATPYEYVARVRAYLQRAPFRYSERAPVAALPLVRFLLSDHRGYCQQFSGAMALLLRMGGVPARVAAGFTPGEHDEIRADWVIRDYDAHSWVEAWFPREGWVTFDPTPRAAPALSLTLPRFRAGDAPQLSPRGKPTAAGAHPGGTHGGTGHIVELAVLIGLPALALLLLLVSVAVRVRRARDEDGIDELADALRRCGREPAPTLTLRQLERRLRNTDAAGAYVRALREQRYGWPGRAPSAGGRRALRRELARGLGLTGRLRALWALPPRRGPI